MKTFNKTSNSSVRTETNASHQIAELSDQQLEKIVQLENEVAALKKQLEATNALLQKFLTAEQIAALRHLPQKWSHQSIIMGYKLRFSLGIHGYNYLRSTGYPIPSYSTLLRHLRSFSVSFGLFEHLLHPLKFKAETFEQQDRYCVLSIDEMEVSGNIDFDKNKQKFLGKVTMGTKNLTGNHITVAIIRGIKHPWKQTIACEVTAASTAGNVMKEFVLKCIDCVEDCGLHVIAVSSDMGSNNRGLWSNLGATVTRDIEKRQIYFVHNEHKIYIVPDVCHLLKNLKSAVLRTGLHLPNSLVASEDLPSNFVNGMDVCKLWEYEMSEEKELRSLHHLKREDVMPNHFNKMNVGAAVRFFSIKTAAALELAVQKRILPPTALTTAFFCRLMDEWFSICASKISKSGTIVLFFSISLNCYCDIF